MNLKSRRDFISIDRNFTSFPCSGGCVKTLKKGVIPACFWRGSLYFCLLLKFMIFVLQPINSFHTASPAWERLKITASYDFTIVSANNTPVTHNFATVSTDCTRPPNTTPTQLIAEKSRMIATAPICTAPNCQWISCPSR